MIIASQDQIRTNIRLSNPLPLPSLEEIEQMEKQRQRALDSLKISKGSVKCQKCSKDVPIVANMARPINDRISVLQVRIRYLEGHYRGVAGKEDDIKQMKQELDELLQDDAEYDKLRGIPLYCSQKLQEVTAAAASAASP